MRPFCKACGKPGPIIDGFCVAHMSLATECSLNTVSAEVVLDLFDGAMRIIRRVREVSHV